MELATHHLPGLVLTDHRFRVPLDHTLSDGPDLEVFAREVVSPDHFSQRRDLPWLVFLQGGPGFSSPRPMDSSGWLGRALGEYRVLLLDQRGTGRSTPVSFQSLARMSGPEEQAAYLRCFRSDGIVADCELIRTELAGKDEPWSVLGQSYGGFCCTRYLSAAPEGLREAFITGGLPALDSTADTIYRRTYPVCARKNKQYYERYPEDVQRLQAIAAHLEEHRVELPGGGPLTLRKLQTLGLLLGFSDGHETIHYLVEDAFVPGSGDSELSYSFLRGFENALHYDTNPIFSVLHEACYTQGTASRWAAQRVREEFPEFDPTRDGPLYLTGEMIYPWYFDEFPTLTPLKEAAELLAHDDTWPELYDPDQLQRNHVPAAAAVYVNDMYVESESSLETARAIRGLRVWVTDELEHNGLRSDGARVFGRLLDLLRGRA